MSALVLVRVSLRKRHMGMFQLILSKRRMPGDYIKLDEYLAEQTGTAETVAAEPQGEEAAPRALPGSQGMSE